MSYHSAITTAVMEFVVSNPEAMSAFVVGFVGAIGHYAKTGRVPVGRLPFRALRDIVRELGDEYFGVRRPRGVTGLLVTASNEELDSELRTRCFESVDIYSYEYEGEVLNLRRPNGLRRNPRDGDLVPMELHVRSFDTDLDGKVWVLAHDEASRFEAWGDHYKETVFSWDRGTEHTKELLDALDLEYEEVESERTAEFAVV